MGRGTQQGAPSKEKTMCHYPPVPSFPNGIAHLCVDGSRCATRHDRHDDRRIEMKKHPPHRKTVGPLSSNAALERFVWLGASDPAPRRPMPETNPTVPTLFALIRVRATFFTDASGEPHAELGA